jgi:hypothetical protein
MGIVRRRHGVALIDGCFGPVPGDAECGRLDQIVYRDEGFRQFCVSGESAGPTVNATVHHRAAAFVKLSGTGSAPECPILVAEMQVSSVLGQLLVKRPDVVRRIRYGPVELHLGSATASTRATEIVFLCPSITINRVLSVMARLIQSAGIGSTHRATRVALHTLLLHTSRRASSTGYRFSTDMTV